MKFKKNKKSIFEYDDDYEITCYFVYYKNPENNNIKLIGYTKDKNILNHYLDFHKCKNFKVKNVTAKNKDIEKMIENYPKSKIQIKELITRDPNHINKDMILLVPITDDEHEMIDGSKENYVVHNMYGFKYIYQLMYYFKDKYQKALNDIYFEDICRRMESVEYNTKIDKITIDEVMLLIKTQEHLFG